MTPAYWFLAATSRQDMTGYYRTGQDTIGQDSTGQDTIRHHNHSWTFLLYIEGKFFLKTLLNLSMNFENSKFYWKLIFSRINAANCQIPFHAADRWILSSVFLCSKKKYSSVLHIKNRAWSLPTYSSSPWGHLQATPASSGGTTLF